MFDLRTTNAAVGRLALLAAVSVTLVVGVSSASAQATGSSQLEKFGEAAQNIPLIGNLTQAGRSAFELATGRPASEMGNSVKEGAKGLEQSIRLAAPSKDELRAAETSEQRANRLKQERAEAKRAEAAAAAQAEEAQASEAQRQKNLDEWNNKIAQMQADAERKTTEAIQTLHDGGLKQALDPDFRNEIRRLADDNDLSEEQQRRIKYAIADQYGAAKRMYGDPNPPPPRPSPPPASQPAPVVPPSAPPEKTPEQLRDEAIRQILDQQAREQANDKERQKKIQDALDEISKAFPPPPKESTPPPPEPPKEPQPPEAPPPMPRGANEDPPPRTPPGDREKDVAMQIIMGILNKTPSEEENGLPVEALTAEELTERRRRAKAKAAYDPFWTEQDDAAARSGSQPPGVPLNLGPPTVFNFLGDGTRPDAAMKKYQDLARQALADGDDNYAERAAAVDAALARQEAASATARQNLYNQQQALLAEERRRQQQIAQQQAANQQRQQRYYVYDNAGSGGDWSGGGWGGGVIDWGGLWDGGWGDGGWGDGWDGGGWGDGGHQSGGMLFDPPQ